MGFLFKSTKILQGHRQVSKLQRDIQIIFQDDDLLVVNKPARLLTLPDRFVPEKPNLITILKGQYPDVMTNHRLDKDTSGILVFTRNAAAHANVSKQFEARTLTKIYDTLVKGIVSEDQGVIDQPIEPHPAIDGKMRVWKGGKPSRSAYEVVQRFRQFTWLKVRIDTGRTHQIRVHCAHIGHALAVDPLYGGDEGVYLSSFKHNYRLNRTHDEQPLIDRLTLHASSITLKHPSTGEVMTFEAPLPKDLRAVQNQLMKWGQ